jgi:hypothetical protein
MSDHIRIKGGEAGWSEACPSKAQVPCLRRAPLYLAVIGAFGLGMNVCHAADAIDLAELGAGGFRIDGAAFEDYSGRSVAGAGDVNGDGLDDLIIGASRADPGGVDRAGESYVVFGKADAASVDLANLGNGGFRIDGIDENDLSGFSVAGAGDVNGDGLADLIISAINAGREDATYAGESYVVFGKADSSAVDLTRLDAGGFRIDGIDEYDRSGLSVAGAGDVNGDGLADLIIGANAADPGGIDEAGESYVVFGKADSNPVDLASLGEGGFRINGVDVADYSGGSVSGAGDVNGDGLDDLIIGAAFADPGENSWAGESYVVFGKSDSNLVDLAKIGAGGFRIDGVDEADRSGLSVAGAGDVNGDGLDDLIIGASRADPGGVDRAGESYVVFGKADNNTVDLASLGAGGFRIDGIEARDYAGSSVAGAGDVNGDGLDDLIIGAPSADPGGVDRAGESYVVFGKTDNANVDLAALGALGFRITGIDSGDYSGSSVSGADDVNGDGLADLIIGAPNADAGGSRAGVSYVVFGPSPTPRPLFFTDRDQFFGATQATTATAPYEDLPELFTTFESGQITFEAFGTARLDFGNFSADFPDDNDIELGLFEKEDLDITLTEGFTFAMGIDFDDRSGGSTPSTFTVTVLAGDNELASFQFETEPLPDQDYIGVWSAAPFNRLEIRETSAANENEFFGTVSISEIPLPGRLFTDRFEPR